MKKKGAFFSTDAIIALVIAFLFLILAYPILKSQEAHTTNLHNDVLSVLSELKTGEIDSFYVQSLIAQGRINDTNKSMIEQIGEFYVTDLIQAKILAQEMLKELNTTENIGLWYGTELLASKNSTPYSSAKNLQTARQIVSGIRVGTNITGFSASAELTNKYQEKYSYFGGYVGDGNITIQIEYNGTIIDSLVEIAVNKNFTAYINGVYSGVYDKSPDQYTPTNYSLPIGNFIQGKNTIEFRGDNLFIAGGFIKIIYDIEESLYIPETKKYLPGIDGIINLYDGFYIPSTPNYLEVFLHYKSTQNIAFVIGNKTILDENSSTEKQLTISDSELRNLLDYNSLGGQTIPLRIGPRELVGALTGGKADIVFVFDTTGSMGSQINSAKSIVLNFTASLQNSSVDWRLALVEFKDYAIGSCGDATDFPYKIHQFNGQNFTTNSTKYQNTIGTLTAKGGFDSAESHLRALNESMKLDYRSDAKKFNIMITDIYPHAIDCIKWGVPTDKSCNKGPKNATEVAQRLKAKGITFYYINKASGLCSNKIISNYTTNLTGGAYYPYTSGSSIGNILLNITSQIANISYSEQTASYFGNISSKLYPDSYIQFNYTQVQEPYGLILTGEKKFLNESSGYFSLPPQSKIIQAKVVSYSGQKWTEKIIANDQKVYDLKYYGTNYTKIGDPFYIQIPSNIIDNVSINNVSLNLGSIGNLTTSGSPYNKIIYTVVKNSSAFTDVSGATVLGSSASGCIWTIQFEDDSTQTIKVPINYDGERVCSYIELSKTHDANDAIQAATAQLFSNMDFDNNGKLDVIFTAEQLQISSTEVSGIPYTWSTEVQARIWF